VVAGGAAIWLLSWGGLVWAGSSPLWALLLSGAVAGLAWVATAAMTFLRDIRRLSAEPPPVTPPGQGGVREPRRPPPTPGAGAAGLEVPTADRRRGNPNVTGTVLGLLAVAVALSGCAGAERIRETATQPPILVNVARSGGDDALASGWLRSYGEGACLVLENGESSVVVWPRGSRPAIYQGGPLVGVIVPGIGLVSPDTFVIGAGGFHTIGSPSRLDLPAVPPGCPSDVTYYVVLWKVDSAE
jgi:hypothetical protein